jgi:hypothetical protein
MAKLQMIVYNYIYYYRFYNKIFIIFCTGGGCMRDSYCFVTLFALIIAAGYFTTQAAPDNTKVFLEN